MGLEDHIALMNTHSEPRMVETLTPVRPALISRLSQRPKPRALLLGYYSFAVPLQAQSAGRARRVHPTAAAT